MSNAWWVNQSVSVLSSFESNQWKENVLRRNNIPFKKNTEKIVIAAERLDTNYCQVQGWKKFCPHFYHSPNILLTGTKHRASKQCVAKLERIENLDFPKEK